MTSPVGRKINYLIPCFVVLDLFVCLFVCVSTGCFSFPSLLLKLVSAVGLLTLTATVVDLLALYVLPNRKKYHKFMYEDIQESAVAEEKAKRE